MCADILHITQCNSDMRHRWRIDKPNFDLSVNFRVAIDR